MTVDDVIQTGKNYRPSGLETLLGIPEQTILHALAAKEFVDTRDLASHTHIGAESVLRWIEEKTIRCQVSELARRGWRSENPDFGLAAAEVIDAAETYPVKRLSKMLRIPLNKVLRAAAAGELRIVAGRDEDQQIRGADLLAWIAKHGIPYAVSREEYLRRKGQAARPGPLDEVVGLLALAIEKLDELRRPKK